MPYQIRKVVNKTCYRVTNKSSKKITARCTTKSKAQKQMRLLNAIQYNRNFVPRGRTAKISTAKISTAKISTAKNQ